MITPSPTFNEVYEAIPGNGWLSENEAELLWYAVNQEVGPILEVGSYQGRSTVLLAATLRRVYAVDPFDGFDDTNDGEKIFLALRDNLLSRNINNVIIYRKRVEDWKHRPVGFAYLDGDHTFKGTMEQIEIAKSCGAMRICIHDYALSGDGLEIKRAIESSKLTVLKIVERMAYCEFPHTAP